MIQPKLTLTERELMLCYHVRMATLSVHHRDTARRADIWEMGQVHRTKARTFVKRAQNYYKLARST